MPPGKNGAHDPLRLQGGLPLRAVPAEGRVGRGDAGLQVRVLFEVGPGIGEVGRPGVEVLVPALLEVGLVREQRGAGMTVGRDHDVAL